jgi:hypothetical protein
MTIRASIRQLGMKRSARRANLTLDSLDALGALRALRTNNKNPNQLRRNNNTFLSRLMNNRSR